MKYLCLVFSDERAIEALPRDAYAALVDAHLDYNEALAEHGHYIASEALESARASAVVRVRNGKLSVTDGPYAETKEQIGGFYLIDARDLNEAIQLAARIPAARIGGVELRAVRTICRASTSAG
jgi:hypothetical protein